MTDRSIRILNFSTLYPDSTRPSHGIFVETRLRHLVASGEVDARVVAPVPWFPSKNPRYGRWAALASVPAEEERNGLRVLHPRYALPPGIGMSIAPWLLALGARKTVSRLQREQDFDLIDAHYYYPDGVAAGLLARWFRKPFVVTGRGTDLNLLPEYWIPRRWIRWAESQAAASILVSRSLMQRLEALGGNRERMHLLPNGVDRERFRPQDRAASRAVLGIGDGPMLLSVGNLVELKGHDIAIRALASLPTAISLCIVGTGEARQALEALTSELGLTERVRFAGTVDQADLPHWYSAADILVLCSSREGAPNVVCEALACGLPVAATPVGGVPELIESPVAGRLLSERTPDALAGAVTEILSSPPERRAVREYAARFDWEATTQGQIRLFRSLLR